MLSDAYAAGFFDGEGSVYVARRNTRPSAVLMVCIGNTHLGVLQEHKDRWGGSIQKRKMVNPNHRQQWQWVLSTRQTRPFLEAIRPYVIIKHEVVELAFKYLELMEMPAGERRDYSHTIVREAKHGGKRLRSSPRLRPEWVARRDKVITAIRTINARGVNALRIYPA